MNKEEKDSNIVKELFEGAHHAIITLSNGNKIAARISLEQITFDFSDNWLDEVPKTFYGTKLRLHKIRKLE